MKAPTRDRGSANQSPGLSFPLCHVVSFRVRAPLRRAGIQPSIIHTPGNAPDENHIPSHRLTARGLNKREGTKSSVFSRTQRWSRCGVSPLDDPEEIEQ